MINQQPLPKESGLTIVREMLRFFCTFLLFVFVPFLSAQQITRQIVPAGYGQSVPRVSPPQVFYQPVKINAPEGVQVSFVSQNQFTEPMPLSTVFGLLTGPDYRIKLTNLPFQPGKEVFPTIKVIGRTFPPTGSEKQFPIPIEISAEDTAAALDGKFITRVIYLEKPDEALPIQGDIGLPIMDIKNGDPVEIAAQIGRPVAVLRIGGRIPNFAGGDLSFFQGSPPWACDVSHDNQNTDVNPAIQRNSVENHTKNSIVIDPNLSTAGDKIAAQRLENNNVNVLVKNEYLFDGGDNNAAVKVDDDWNVKNLDTKDTVVHFDTIDGRVLVEPSNRIEIYAPRFGSVRKTEGIINNVQITALSGANTQAALSASNTAEKIGRTEQNTQTGYARVQNQLGGVASRSAGGETSGDLRTLGYSNYESVMYYSNFLRQQHVSANELLELAKGSVNARAWQGIEGVKIQVNLLAPAEASTIDGAESIFQIKADDSKTSKIRLIKIADKKTAQPGDIIQFTLRFDNIGNQPIGNVTVLDNLTTRLEFLSGTAKSSVASGFTVEPNDSGSFVLRFEITDPLLPNQFGVVQFQCRVR
ncbi:hypothetical protein FACS189427_06440 [Planctomycetales bacterium]|nr:hypothetical protein FACS189427_06440 [Planctomycetales bacterium]